MPDIASQLNELFELLVNLLLIPGNYVAFKTAGIASNWFSVHPALLADGGTLAVWISAVFWLLLLIETWLLYRYALALYHKLFDTWYQCRQWAERQLRRYRIFRACQKAGPASTEQTATVHELDELALATLRMARDARPAAAATTATLRQAAGANNGDISRVLQQLEQLQLISRTRINKQGNEGFSLTATGRLYLQTCEG